MSEYHSQLSDKFYLSNSRFEDVQFSKLDFNLIKHNWTAILQYLFFTERTMTVGPIPIELITVPKSDYHLSLDWRKKHNNITHQDGFKIVCYQFVQFLYYILSGKIVNFQRMKPNLKPLELYNILTLDDNQNIPITYDGFYFSNNLYSTSLKIPSVHTADCGALLLEGLNFSSLVHLPVTGAIMLIQSLRNLNLQPQKAFLGLQSNHLIYPNWWYEQFVQASPQSKKYFTSLSDQNKRLAEGQNKPERDGVIFSFQEFLIDSLFDLGVTNIELALNYLGVKDTTILNQHANSNRTQKYNNPYGNMVTLGLSEKVFE